MNKEIIIYSCLLLLGVFIASVAQIFLKKSALKEHKKAINEYFNWQVFIGYGLMFASTVFSILAYKIIPISLGVILDATGYLFVTIFGVCIFKEHISKKRLCALGLIVSGIMVYTLCG